MDEDGQLFLKLLFLTGLGGQTLDLIHGVGEQVRAAQAFPFVAHERGQPLPQRSKRGVQGMELLRQLLRAAHLSTSLRWFSRSRRDWCSCWPCRSKSSEEKSWRSARVTGVDWMKSDPRPLDFSMSPEDDLPVLRFDAVRLKPDGGLRVAAQGDDPRDAACSSAPDLMMEVSVLSPRRRPRAPTRMDLPAPVSPLRTFRPSVKRTCSLSMMAKLWT